MGYYERKVGRLFKACATNDLALLTESLSETHTVFNGDTVDPAEIESIDGEGNTPLMIAAKHGSRDVLRQLIERKAIPTARNKKGETALMLAAAGGHREVMADLLEKGLKTDDLNNSGQNALMYAAMYGHGHIIKFLIERKAGVNDTCHASRTPLMYAAENGSEIAIIALLEAGADINARSNDGSSALMFASAKGHRIAVQALLAKNADLSFRNTNGHTARDFYCKDVIEEYLKQGEREAAEKAEREAVHIKAFTVIEKPKVDVDAKTSLAEKVATAMEREGLDPAKSEHWLPAGNTAIEYITASTDSPKMLSNSFNFAARQYVTSGKNLLTGENYAVQTGALEAFPNQDMVLEAHGRLIKLGKEPPAWPPKKARLPSL